MKIAKEPRYPHFHAENAVLCFAPWANCAYSPREIAAIFCSALHSPCRLVEVDARNDKPLPRLHFGFLDALVRNNAISTTHHRPRSRLESAPVRETGHSIHAGPRVFPNSSTTAANILCFMRGIAYSNHALKPKWSTALISDAAVVLPGSKDTRADPTTTCSTFAPATAANAVDTFVAQPLHFIPSINNVTCSMTIHSRAYCTCYFRNHDCNSLVQMTFETMTCVEGTTGSFIFDASDRVIVDRDIVKPVLAHRQKRKPT